MRCVNVVKEKRDELKAEREEFIKTKERLFPYPTRYIDLNKEDRPKHTYIVNVIGKMDMQINALEFALNEDTEITDVPETVNFNGMIDKQALLKEDKCDCDCGLCRRQKGCMR